MKLGLGQYVDGSSPLHRVSPTVKVAAIVLLMCSTFLVTTPGQMLLASAMVCCLCLAAGSTPWRVLRSCLPVAVGLWLISALNLFVTRSGPVVWQAGPLSVTADGAATALLYCVRLTVLLMTAGCLLLTTTPTELSGAFGTLLSPLKRLGVPVDQVALVLALALRFVPLLAEETESVLLAQEARGASFSTGGPLRRAAALPSLVVPVFAGAIRHAHNLSRALEARGYDPAVPRTRWSRRTATAAQGHRAGIVFVALAVVYVMGLALLAL